MHLNNGAYLNRFKTEMKGRLFETVLCSMLIIFRSWAQPFQVACSMAQRRDAALQGDNITMYYCDIKISLTDPDLLYSIFLAQPVSKPGAVLVPF